MAVTRECVDGPVLSEWVGSLVLWEGAPRMPGHCMRVGLVGQCCGARSLGGACGVGDGCLGSA